jgi:hypothetical protein
MTIYTAEECNAGDDSWAANGGHDDACCPILILFVGVIGYQCGERTMAPPFLKGCPHQGRAAPRGRLSPRRLL